MEIEKSCLSDDLIKQSGFQIRKPSMKRGITYLQTRNGRRTLDFKSALTCFTRCWVRV